jgi:hypothetical protein
MTVRQDGASRSVLRSVGARLATQQLSLISASNALAPQMIEARRSFKTARFNIKVGGSKDALSHFRDE